MKQRPYTQRVQTITDKIQTLHKNGWQFHQDAVPPHPRWTHPSGLNAITHEEATRKDEQRQALLRQVDIDNQVLAERSEPSSGL